MNSSILGRLPNSGEPSEPAPSTELASEPAACRCQPTPYVSGLCAALFRAAPEPMGVAPTQLLRRWPRLPTARRVSWRVSRETARCRRVSGAAAVADRFWPSHLAVAEVVCLLHSCPGPAWTSGRFARLENQPWRGPGAASDSSFPAPAGTFWPRAFPCSCRPTTGTPDDSATIPGRS